jgi:integrase
LHRLWNLGGTFAVTLGGFMARRQPRRVKLTDRTIRALPRPDPGRDQVEYWDQDLPGFGVRVGETGYRSYVALFRVRGRKRRLTIGSCARWPLAEARERARKALRAADDGDDPTAPDRARRGSLTVGQLADIYIEQYARKQKRTWKNDRSLIDSYIAPELGDIRVPDLTRARIRDMLRPIAESTSHQANRCHEVIRRMLSWGIAEDKIDIVVNPAAGIGKLQSEPKRARTLREDEFPRLWAALDPEGKHLRAAVMLLLLTAQREMEVLHMSTTELDGPWWTIPAARSKNGLAHRVPLVPTARRIITGLTQDRPNGGFVFSRDGCSPLTRNAVAKYWPGVLARAQIEDLRLHDLRRSAATQMASAGVDRLVIGKLLNHTDGTVTGVYERHSYDMEKAAAFAQWEARLLQLVGSNAGAPS